MVFDGHYGKPGHRRQRYRCHPPNGEEWHRFTPPVPRQGAVGVECEHCERELHTHEGPQTPRASLVSARDVALGLVEVGRGETYRAASARVRTRAARHPLRHDGPSYSRHGQLVADFVEVFARVVFEPYHPLPWPEGTLVLDQVPFGVKAYAANGRPIPGGVVAFNVFGALGYHGRGVLWRLQAFHSAATDDWESFLCALDGEPKRVVCDAHAASAAPSSTPSPARTSGCASGTCARSSGSDSFAPKPTPTPTASGAAWRQRPTACTAGSRSAPPPAATAPC